MAWVAPSGRAIVLSVPGTPGPAVAGPLTGGQIWAQLPLHFDVVAVSGANQYRVKPWALVSTAVPLIVVVFSALPDTAAPDAAPGGALAAVLGDELPHAATVSAPAITAADARKLIRQGCLP